MTGRNAPKVRSQLRVGGLEDLVAAKHELSDRTAASNVHAVGIGRKLTSGKKQRTRSVRVYVTRKLPRSQLPNSAVVPTHIEGIPTDVVEAPVAHFAMLAACTRQRRRQQRPLVGGISGANELTVAGTLGLVCRSTRAGEGTLRLMLSNCHVLAEFGLAKIGSAILQPAIADGGTSADRFATLLRYVPIVGGSTSSNQVDAAVAVIDDGIAARRGICTVGDVDDLGAVSLDLGVHKHGRTTGYTLGVVDDVALDALVPMGRTPGAALARFEDQIRIVPEKAGTAVAQSGDSGAVVVRRDKPHAVGLLFSCPDDGSYALLNPMKLVMDALDIGW